MLRAGVLLLLVVSSCAHAARPPKPVPPAPPTPAPTAPTAPVATEPPRACPPDEARAVERRIRALDAPMRALTDTATVRAELASIWHHRCLRAFSQLFPLPPPSTPAASLRESWDGLSYALGMWNGGLPEVDHHRAIVIPPELVPALDDDERRALAPWLCKDGDPSCARSQSYIHTAEHVFDLEAAKSGPHRDDDPSDCTKETTFDGWARCTVHRQRPTHRFPRETLRAPERGWLVLRGRRGHYAFADGIRAYDLATGAAYVAESSSRLVLGPTVDFAKTDAQRSDAVYAGRLAPDQVREIAFSLLVARAVKPIRAEVVSVPVPDAIPFTIPDEDGDDTVLAGISGEGLWGSSAQTHIAYAIVDGPRVLAEGELTWPDSPSAIESYVDDRLVATEAGLVRGCAPAPLPAVLGRGAGGVSRIDADPARQGGVFHGLEQTLRAFRPVACK